MNTERKAFSEWVRDNRIGLMILPPLLGFLAALHMQSDNGESNVNRLRQWGDVEINRPRVVTAQCIDRSTMVKSMPVMYRSTTLLEVLESQCR